MAISLYPKFNNKLFSWEIIAKPQDMFIQNISHIEMYSLLINLFFNKSLNGITVNFVGIYIGFGLKTNEHNDITPKNMPPIIKNIRGNETDTNNVSIKGDTTNLPSPKPCYCQTTSQPLMVLEIRHHLLYRAYIAYTCSRTHKTASNIV